MSVDTKGFVLTRCKDVFLVCNLINKSLDGLIAAEKKVAFPDRTAFLSERARESFQSCNVSLSTHAELVSFRFVFAGEARDLKVFFTCDNDQKEFGPSSVSMSMGCWGTSSLFMKTILHALSVLGPVYFDANDCDETPPALLGERRVTVMGALQLGYLVPFDIQTWLKAWDRQSFVSEFTTADEFFGAPEARIRDCATRSDFKSGWEQLEGIAAAGPLATPSFLEDWHEQAMGFKVDEYA